MKLAFLQTRPVFGDVKGNVERAVKKILALRADLVVLPELFSTGYQFSSMIEARAAAEDVPGGFTTERLAEAARAGGVYIVAGIAERAGTRVYNTAVLIGPGGARGAGAIIGKYRKAHLFWDEKRFFAAGDTRFEVYDIGMAKVGMMICYDWRFPEVARALALGGADIICHPANLVLPHCPAAMVTRAVENRVFTVTANRVGIEERERGRRLKFIGRSRIVDPDGKILARAAPDRAQSRVVRIDPLKARDKFITPKNHLFKDRREDLY